MVVPLTTGLALWALGPWRARQVHVSQPAGWRVHDDRLTVLDEAGSLLWTRTFAPGLGDHDYQASTPRQSSDRPVRIEDLDGDGAREVVFAVRTVDGAAPLLHVFEADGTPRFTFTLPTSPVRFGKQEYSPTWLIQGTWITQSTSGDRSVWVLYHHRPFFPSLLVQLDAHGQVRSHYVSNGYIVSVAAVRWKGANTVLVGAASNETRGGSLAIFRGRTVHGSAPAADPRYRCTSCPPGGPDEFLVFPRACPSNGAGETSRVEGAWVDPSGTITAVVAHGWAPEALDRAHTGPVIYLFDRNLAPQRAEIHANYVRIHRVLERAGAIDHPVGPRDISVVFPVRRWAGTRFEDLPPAPVEIDR